MRTILTVAGCATYSLPRMLMRHTYVVTLHAWVDLAFLHANSRARVDINVGDVRYRFRWLAFATVDDGTGTLAKILLPCRLV